MSLAHPDPEGHLTDLTITALVKLRDEHLASYNDALEQYKQAIEAHDDHGANTWGAFVLSDSGLLESLNEILEPWGEGPTDA